MQGFTMAAILTFLRYVGSSGLIRWVDYEWSYVQHRPVVLQG